MSGTKPQLKTRLNPMFYLCMCLFGGLLGCGNQPTTVEEVQETLEAHAKRGDPAAQNQWGYNLIFGQGVEQRVEEGLVWIQKAAAQNHGKALYNLPFYINQANGWIKILKRLSR